MHNEDRESYNHHYCFRFIVKINVTPTINSSEQSF
jgi:hypothetical protein